MISKIRSEARTKIIFYAVQLTTSPYVSVNFSELDTERANHINIFYKRRVGGRVQFPVSNFTNLSCLGTYV